jgi:hypothetical protein
MRVADHIHLRCPSNIGCWVACSNSFPKTPKSAKYAGNWDPKLKSLGRINCNNGFGNFLNQKYESFSVWSLGWSVLKIFILLRRAILRWTKCD